MVLTQGNFCLFNTTLMTTFDGMRNKDNRFQGFETWLIVNEAVTPTNAYPMVSRLRDLENEILKSDKLQVEPLHKLYAKLQIAGTRKSKDSMVQIKHNISKVFKAITENPNTVFKKHEDWRIADYKKIYILFLKFLGEMTGAFSLDSLEEEGCIIRQRKSKSKVCENDRIPIRHLKNGLVAQIAKNINILFNRDSRMVTMSLDTLHDFIENYVENYGNGNVDIMRTTSMIVAHNPSNFMDFKGDMLRDISFLVDGTSIFTEDVKSVSFDPVDASLLLYKDDVKQQVKLSVLSGRKPKQRGLSVRVVPVESMSALAFRLVQIRNACHALMQELKYYIEEMKQTKPRRMLTDEYENDGVMHYELVYPNISDDDYCNIVKRALDGTNENRVLDLGVHIFQLLAEYASGFKYELVVE